METKDWRNREIFFVDNVEHLLVKKISYTYKPHGRGGKQNQTINFLDEYNRIIKRILMPYYGLQCDITSINTLHDKFIIIATDLYDHKNAILKNNGYKYSLYIFSIDDLIKPCLNSTNLSKSFHLTDSIPSYIPCLSKDIIGKVVE